MTKPKCEICKIDIPKKRFTPKHPNVRFCSPVCTKVSWYRKRKPAKALSERERICATCKVVFIADLWHPNAQGCSKKCQRRQDYLKNIERYKAEALEWARNNRHKTRVTQKNYYWKNVDKSRAQAKARGTGRIKLTDWIQLCALNENCCRHCGIKADYKTLSVDHILPISLGGGNNIENLQPLCLPCNQSKGNRFVG